MTTPKTVIKALKMLKSSALDYAPRDGIEDLIDTWINVFRDVPDDVFETAISDYLRSESRWPAPARIMTLAKRIDLRGGHSAVGSFKQEPAGRRYPPYPPRLAELCSMAEWTEAEHAEAERLALNYQSHVEALCSA